MSSDARNELLRAFARRVRSNIARELESENELSLELKATIVPLVRSAIETARTRGMCDEAWLFGSFAWGDPVAGSDVDLLVRGCTDPDALAAMVMQETDRMVHVVVAESAPESLRTRVIDEGLSL